MLKQKSVKIVVLSNGQYALDVASEENEHLKAIRRDLTCFMLVYPDLGKILADLVLQSLDAYN